MNLLTPVNQDPSFIWDEAAARHLLNRAGFGVPPSAIARLTAMSPFDAVTAFISYENLPDVAAPPPDDLPAREDYRQYQKLLGEVGEAQARKNRQEFRRQEKDAMVRLQTWWIDRMGKSQRPLQEKMALFWHGHFATSAEKVQSPRDNLHLNEIFRNQAMGNFQQLVTAVGKSPAMMRYLDQQKSNKKKPNENWARELMELFTLGIGHYTEADIKAAARAFTGWYVRDGEFYYAVRQHDAGPKTIFGQTANYDGDDVIRLITARPECARFICTKLWRYFAYDDPEPEVIDGLAKTFQDNKTNLRPVLRQMFLSRAFFQEKARFCQVKSPAQLVVGLQGQLTLSDGDLADKIGAFAMRAMGQSLFYPPNVKGWDGGHAWINTNTLLVRYNFSSFLVSGVVPDLSGQRGGNQVRREFLMTVMGKASGGRGRNGDSMMNNNDSMGAMDAPPAKADADENAPAGQDAMPRDIPSRTFYQKLHDRKQARKDNRNLTPAQRKEAAKQQSAMAAAPFQARKFFIQYKGKDADEILDALAAYFIGFPLDDQQKNRLRNVLAQGVQPGQPVPVDKMAEEDLRATVQLLLSTVEYQVC